MLVWVGRSLYQRASLFADRDTLIPKTPGTCMHPCTDGHVRRTVLVPEDAFEVVQVVLKQVEASPGR